MKTTIHSAVLALCERDARRDKPLDEHGKICVEALRVLAFFDEPPRIRDEEEYRLTWDVKKFLSSLACFTFNNKLPEDDRVWALEGKWAKALATYNRRLELKDRNARVVARYLLWHRYWTMVDAEALFEDAKLRGILRKRTQRSGTSLPVLYVVGLSMMVGDNTFTVVGKRHYRNYNRTIGRQAFAVQQQCPFADPGWFADIPELDEVTWIPAYVADGKHAARPIALTNKEKGTILALFHPSYRTKLSDTLPRAVAG